MDREVTTQASLDSDGQWREKVIPDTMTALPAINNWRYVSPGGSDTADAGTLQKPYGSLQYAVSQITDAAPDKRYALLITGTILSTDNVMMKPNVFFVGTSPQQSRVSSGGWFLEPGAWTGTDDNRAGFVNLGVAGDLVLYFDNEAADAGKFYLLDAWTLNEIDMRAATVTNQLIATHVHFFDVFSAYGGQVETTGCTFHVGAAIRDNTHPAFAVHSAGDLFLAGLSLDQMEPAACSAVIDSLIIGQLHVTGFTPKMGALPALVSYSNGAKIEVQNVPCTAGANGRRWLSGSSSPAGVVLGNPGDLYVNTSGGVATTFWVKESGINTAAGWAPK